MGGCTAYPGALRSRALSRFELAPKNPRAGMDLATASGLVPSPNGTRRTPLNAPPFAALLIAAALALASCGTLPFAQVDRSLCGRSLCGCAEPVALSGSVRVVDSSTQPVGGVRLRCRNETFPVAETGPDGAADVDTELALSPGCGFQRCGVISLSDPSGRFQTTNLQLDPSYVHDGRLLSFELDGGIVVLERAHAGNYSGEATGEWQTPWPSNSATWAQEDSRCPGVATQDGVADGWTCAFADLCSSHCCTCPNGTNQYRAKACHRARCGAAEVACADALAAEPRLCP